MGFWFTLRGSIAGAVAFIICPCHLPVTLPLLLTLTAGTAVGGWLANNGTMVTIGSAVLFIAWLVLAVKWLIAGERKACAIEPAGKSMQSEGQ